MEYTQNIVGITLGIKYAKSFRIPDIAGEIVDSILYNKNSPFGAKTFPKLQENSVRERTLYNPDTTEYLRINTDDMILGLVVKNDQYDEKIKWITDTVLPFFMDELYPEFEIKNIRRIGIMFDHKIEKYPSIEKAVEILTKGTYTEAQNVSISFSKKLGSAESYRKDVNDYKNTIYSFFEAEDYLLARLDYQYYYDPVPEDLRDCFAEKIINGATHFLKNNYHKWIADRDEK